MNKTTFAFATLVGVSAAQISMAATPVTPILTAQGTAAPAPALASAPVAPAPIAASAAAAAAAPARLAMPDGRPTLGQWEDLAERQAFKDQLAKLNGDNTQQGQQALIATPPAALRAPLSLDAAPKKPRRASDSCGEGNSACFYAVYGIHVDGGDNNYHGLMAIDGLIETVSKGKRFTTSRGSYTVRDISTRELTYVDQHGRLHTVPFSGEADEQADPAELKAEQKPMPGQPMMPGFMPR